MEGKSREKNNEQRFKTVRGKKTFQNKVFYFDKGKENGKEEKVFGLEEGNRHGEIFGVGLRRRWRRKRRKMPRRIAVEADWMGIEGTKRGPCGPKKNVAMHSVTFTKCGQINFCLSAAQSLFINNSRQGNESK